MIKFMVSPNFCEKILSSLDQLHITLKGLEHMLKWLICSSSSVYGQWSHISQNNIFVDKMVLKKIMILHNDLLST